MMLSHILSSLGRAVLFAAALNPVVLCGGDAGGAVPPAAPPVPAPSAAVRPCGAGPVAVGLQVFDDFNRHDLTALLSRYAPAVCVRHVQGCSQGLDGVARMVKKWDHAFDDLRFEPLCFTQEGGDGVIHWRARGLFVRELNGIAPTGRAAVVHGMTRFRLQDGKIIQQWSYVDYHSLAAPSAPPQ